jgi:hypothetical protein
VRNVYEIFVGNSKGDTKWSRNSNSDSNAKELQERLWILTADSGQGGMMDFFNKNFKK